MELFGHCFIFVLIYKEETERYNFPFIFVTKDENLVTKSWPPLKQGVPCKPV